MRDLIPSLQTVALQIAQEVGFTGFRVSIQDANGHEGFSVAIPRTHTEPPTVLLPQPQPSPPQLPAKGWDFSEPWPRFNGEFIEISGKSLELLRALAQAKGPLGVDDLRRRVWPEYMAEEVTIRWTVKKLRTTLAERFKDVEEPIVSRPGFGYVLAVK